VTILGKPKADSLSLEIGNRSFTSITLLGDRKPLQYTQMGRSLSIKLPEHLVGDYAYCIKLAGYAR